MENKISKVTRYSSSLEKDRPLSISADKPDGEHEVIPLKFQFKSNIGEPGLKRDNLLTKMEIDIKLGTKYSREFFYSGNTKVNSKFKNLPIFNHLVIDIEEGQSAYQILKNIHRGMMNEINPSTRKINNYYAKHDKSILGDMYADFEFFYDEPCEFSYSYKHGPFSFQPYVDPIALTPWNTKLMSNDRRLNGFKFFYSHRFTIKPFYDSEEIVYEIFEFHKDSPIHPDYFILYEVHHGKASILPKYLIYGSGHNKSTNIYALMVLLWKFMDIDDIMIHLRTTYKKDMGNKNYNLLNIILNAFNVTYEDIQSSILKELIEEKRKAEEERIQQQIAAIAKIEEQKKNWNFAPKYKPIKPIITPVIKGKANPEYKESYELYGYPDEVVFADEIDPPKEEENIEEEVLNSVSLMDKILIGRIGNSTQNKILELEGLDYNGDDIAPYVKIFETQKEEGLY